MPGFLIPAALAIGAAVALLVVFAFARSFLHVCTPNEVLIFSGRKHRLADGTERGFRVVVGGRGWRYPVLETVNRMNLNVMEVGISIRNAYSQGGIPLHVDAIANIKISSERAVIANAIERFLGRDPGEIRRVAKETLEGHLRGVLATLTPEEINEDRLKFAAKLRTETEDDLNKLGIHLDTLKVQHVTDEVGYLDSIGREAIANVVKDAEMAESDARREAEEEVASNEARASVTVSKVEAAVAQMQNELRRTQAELESKVKSEEQTTLAAAREARAVAEKQLQEIRSRLEGVRLQTERVLPAEADQAARTFSARGEAAAIRERGKAVALALDALREAWTLAGKDALSIYLIEELPRMMGEVSDGIGKVKIDHLSMVDGGDGKLMAAYVAAYPQMMRAVFDALAQTTGIDIPATVTGVSK